MSEDALTLSDHIFCDRPSRGVPHDDEKNGIEPNT